MRRLSPRDCCRVTSDRSQRISHGSWSTSQTTDSKPPRRTATSDSGCYRQQRNPHSVAEWCPTDPISGLYSRYVPRYCRNNHCTQFTHMTVGCIGISQPVEVPLEPATTLNSGPNSHRQPFCSPPSPSQLLVAQDNRGSRSVLTAATSTTVVPRAPVGSTCSPAGDSSTPADPFIHVHFPGQPTPGQPPLAHFQTIIVQTPHRFNIPMTPVLNRRNIRPTVTSPSTATVTRRGLAAVSESSDADGDGSDNPPPKRAASKKTSTANDVWKFFRSEGLKTKGHKFCLFCEYVQFHYHLSVRIINL